MSVVLPAAGVLIWLVRLEASVKRAHERHDDLRADLSEIKDDVKDIKRWTLMGGGPPKP